MLGTWPYLSGDGILSPDGKFAVFTVRNYPVGSFTLVVKSLKDSWQKEVYSRKKINNFFFSHDSKSLFVKNEDTLLIFKMGLNTRIAIGIDFFSLPKNDGKYVVYRSKADPANFTLLNLNTLRETSFSEVEDALFDDYGKTLLLKSRDKNRRYQLIWLDLQSQKSNFVWSGEATSQPGGYQFSKDGKHLAFLTKSDNGNQVFYYKKGMDKAVERLTNDCKELNGELLIDQVSGFSANGIWLFIKGRRPKTPEAKADPRKVSVDIWSYRDEVLYPSQHLSSIQNLTADIVLKSDGSASPVLLNSDGVLTGLNSGITHEIKGNHWILRSDTNEGREKWWPHSADPQCWVVALKDGTRKLLPKSLTRAKFSPTGKWITYWVKQEDKYDYFSYNIVNGDIINLTKSIPSSVAMEKMAIIDSIPVGIAGWFANDEAVLIYDNYDIWKIDPAGINAPINFTKGFGKMNNIKLRLFHDEGLDDNVIDHNKKEFLLSGYNESNKYNGFLRLNIKNNKEPELVSMVPFSWFKKMSQIGNSAVTANLLMVPIEAGIGSNHKWLLMGESSTDYPNYYYTTNFKDFVRITDFEPQKKFNWFTTELVSWKMFDGQISQGVLYKPEDFDSTKRYPIIFNYYERFSGWMYSFIYPQLTNGKINIPWFVSRGYLVFTPDIYFSVGKKTGISSCEHAYNSIVSAAEFLTLRSYVDKDHMAIQGHSFGGLLTNYLLTHSNIFAAAAEGAGFSDEMSSYLTLAGKNLANPLDNASTQSHKENDHALYGTTPWESPELFRKNSPVWDADKASAPLLIVHNKKDQQVQWRQAVEMYMALRRLGKPCWMLQYDNGEHSVSGKDAEDFTIRLTQFFDHYLKELPAPRWMTLSIPAKLKQVEGRLELDVLGNCSISCKVCNLYKKGIK